MTEERSIEHLAESDDWAGYEPPPDNIRPPDPLEYTFKRVTDADTFSFGIFNYNDEDHAWFNFRAEIQDGPEKGRIAFGGCNTMMALDRQATGVQDFIMAANSGIRPTKAGLLREIRNEMPSTMEKVVGPFAARTTWKWRCGDCDEEFLRGSPKKVKVPKKYKGPDVNLAKLGDGTFNHEQPCPMCKKTIGAQLVITRFVVPKAGARTAEGPRPTQVAPEGMAPSAG